MKYLNNRKVAAVILAVCVLGSIIGFGGGALIAQRRSAMRVFNEGVDPTLSVRFSMDAYLENCAGYARAMAEEFRMYVDAEDDTAARALELAKTIGDGDDLDARYADYAELCGLTDALYTDMHSANLSEEQLSVFKKAYANYQGEVSKIGYDEYRSLATRFNREKEGFPASALAKLFGLDNLNPF